MVIIIEFPNGIELRCVRALHSQPRHGNSESELRYQMPAPTHDYPRSQMVAAILRREMEAQNRVPMIEVIKAEAVHIMETKRCQRVVAKNKIST
jgi:hypothetical protein